MAYDAVGISTMSVNYMGVISGGLQAWESGYNIAHAKDKAAMAKRDSESYQLSNSAAATASLEKAKFYRALTKLAVSKDTIVVKTGDYRMACLNMASSLINCAIQPGVSEDTRQMYFAAAQQYRENAKAAMEIGTCVEIPTDQAQALGIGGEMPQ
jgi:hypothetical protein